MARRWVRAHSRKIALAVAFFPPYFGAVNAESKQGTVETYHQGTGDRWIYIQRCTGLLSPKKSSRSHV
jgi:hypothetical protein